MGRKRGVPKLVQKPCWGSVNRGRISSSLYSHISNCCINVCSASRVVSFCLFVLFVFVCFSVWKTITCSQGWDRWGGRDRSGSPYRKMWSTAQSFFGISGIGHNTWKLYLYHSLVKSALRVPYVFVSCPFKELFLNIEAAKETTVSS